jgi:hypothetical protein
VSEKTTDDAGTKAPGWDEEKGHRDAIARQTTKIPLEDATRGSNLADHLENLLPRGAIIRHSVFNPVGPCNSLHPLHMTRTFPTTVQPLAFAQTTKISGARVLPIA